MINAQAHQVTKDILDRRETVWFLVSALKEINETLQKIEKKLGAR